MYDRDKRNGAEIRRYHYRSRKVPGRTHYIITYRRDDCRLRSTVKRNDRDPCAGRCEPSDRQVDDTVVARQRDKYSASYVATRTGWTVRSTRDCRQITRNVVRNCIYVLIYLFFRYIASIACTTWHTGPARIARTISNTACEVM